MTAAAIVPGIHCDSTMTLVVASLILGIFNAVLKPVLLLLSLPLVLLTFGLFIPIINAFLLKLTSMLVSDFHVADFWAALLGAIVISLVSFLVNALVKREGRPQIIYRDRAISSGKKIEKVIDL